MKSIGIFFTMLLMFLIVIVVLVQINKTRKQSVACENKGGVLVKGLYKNYCVQPLR